MGTTTASDLASGQIAMVGAARYTFEHVAVMSNFVTKMTLGSGEKSIFVPKFGGVTAKDLTDGVDMTEAQSLTLTGTTHVTDEAGCKVIITDKLVRQLKEDAYRACGKVIGNAMGKKIDEDLLALFSGLSLGVGAAAAVATINYILAAITQLKGQDEPVPEPYYTVLHPYTAHVMVDLFATPAYNSIFMPEGIQTSVLKEHFVGLEKIYRTPIFVDGNISVDSSDDAYGAVFSKLAFIYLVGQEPTTWRERDNSLRGWEIGIVADYGAVEEDDSYGRYLLFDATMPTA